MGRNGNPNPNGKFGVNNVGNRTTGLVINAPTNKSNNNTTTNQSRTNNKKVCMWATKYKNKVNPNGIKGGWGNSRAERTGQGN